MSVETREGHPGGNGCGAPEFTAFIRVPRETDIASELCDISRDAIIRSLIVTTEPTVAMKMLIAMLVAAAFGYGVTASVLPVTAKPEPKSDIEICGRLYCNVG